MRLMTKPKVNFVITAQPVTIYDAHGNPTDVVRERIQRQTRYMCDVVLHMEKRFSKGMVVPQYVTVLDKCRYQRGLNMEIPNITYEELVKALKEKLGVVIGNV